MSEVITGLFEKSIDASIAIYKLESLGIRESDISIVANDSYAKEDFAVDEGNKAAEGGIIGATSTGVLAAGGAGAAAGGTIGAIIGAFIPEHEIKYYEDAIKKGSILVGVKYTSDNKDEIKKILELAGAENVSKA